MKQVPVCAGISSPFVTPLFLPYHFLCDKITDDCWLRGKSGYDRLGEK